MKLAAFDIGGTALKMGIITDQGKIISSDEVDVSDNSREKILQAILSWLKKNPQVDGIAISIPGYVDPQSGFISMGGTIRDFDQFHLAQWLEEKTSLTVSVENDAHCALLAERWQGKAKNMADFLMITIGTGLGGAAFCNNALVRGKRDRAGEFGCMLVTRPAGDNLSRFTMAESCTMTALRENFAQQTGKACDDISGEDVFDAYDAKQPIAERLVSLFYQDLCGGIYNLASIFDPECIYLGGGITARETFLQEVHSHLQKLGLDINVDTATYGNDSGMLGAAYHFLQTHGTHH